MYQHKLANLKKQLDELHQLTHPDYVRKLKKIDFSYKDRLRLNEIYRDYLKDCVERDYVLEIKAAEKEYEEKKVRTAFPRGQKTVIRSSFVLIVD